LTTGSDGDLQAASQLRGACAGVELVPLPVTRRLTNCAAAAVQGKPLQAAVCQSPELRLRFRQLLETGCFDVVHIEHLRAADIVSSIPDEVPALFDAVDSISLLLERTLRSSHSLRQRLIACLELHRTRRFEAQVLRRFAAVIATAPDDARALEQLASGIRVSVVPNGVDLDYFQPNGLAPEPATLVLSGKMSYHANISAALHFVREIWPLVRKSRPDVRLRIVGSNPPREVQRLARDTAISVTGHVSDIRSAVAGATLAVCPVTVKVGVQNKVLEAMAMGLPVVCTAIGAAGIDARPGHDFLVADTPVRFAQEVVRLLSDGALRNRLAVGGRTYVETHHQWNAAAHRLEELYAGALETRRLSAAACLEAPHTHARMSVGSIG
jgi:glycosyltransferase involved in cell wall biosynthesis